MLVRLREHSGQKKFVHGLFILLSLTKLDSLCGSLRFFYSFQYPILGAVCFSSCGFSLTVCSASCANTGS